jgi:hypothetical protein
MTAVAFDTLKLARKLRDTAQMSQAQAEGVADALAEAMSGAELATKPDIAAVRADIATLATKGALAESNAELRANLVEVEHHLEAKIADVLVAVANTRTEIAAAKTDTLRWVFAAVVGQTALIVGLLKLWH